MGYIIAFHIKHAFSSLIIIFALDWENILILAMKSSFIALSIHYRSAYGSFHAEFEWNDQSLTLYHLSIVIHQKNSCLMDIAWLKSKSKFDKIYTKISLQKMTLCRSKRVVIIQWLETKFFVTQMRKLLWATFFQNDIDFFLL